MSHEPPDPRVFCTGGVSAEAHLPGRPLSCDPPGYSTRDCCRSVTGQLARQIQRDLAMVTVTVALPASQLRPGVLRPASAAGSVGRAQCGRIWCFMGSVARAPGGEECGRHIRSAADRRIPRRAGSRWDRSARHNGAGFEGKPGPGGCGSAVRHGSRYDRSMVRKTMTA